MMPTIRIDDEVWTFLQSKAKPFEDSPNDVLRRELGIDRLPATQMKRHSTPVSIRKGPQRGAINLLLPNTDYTYHRVTAYTLDGKHLPAQTFKDVLLGVSNHLRREHLSVFDDAALSLRGKKRPYFSLDPKDLRNPARVPDSNLFVETNLNANLIASVCVTLVRALGHKIEDFQIK